MIGGSLKFHILYVGGVKKVVHMGVYLQKDIGMVFLKRKTLLRF